MNKQGLIDFVASKTESTKKEAERALNAVLEGIISGLKTDQKIQLIGFGSFVVQTRSARKGRNPRTGAEITIPAKNAVVFKPGKEFKAAINHSG